MLPGINVLACHGEASRQQRGPMKQACYLRTVHVYVIQHVASGRVYVGKANDVVRRWRGHLSSARRGKGQYFHAAIRKYGEAAFSFSEIHSFASEGEALEAEREIIASRRSNEEGYGFNLNSGGKGGASLAASTKAKIGAIARGRKASSETRARMSASQRARAPHSEETRAKLSRLNKGKKHSAEHVERNRIAQLNRGLKHSPESLAKMSAVHRGRKHSVDHVAKQAEATRATARRRKTVFQASCAEVAKAIEELAA